jgi:hypothetical protein
MQPKFYDDFAVAVFGLLIGMVVCIVVAFALGYPIMILWNSCLVPAVVGVKEITWLQSVGVMVLFSLLFKNNQPSRTK